MTRIHSDWLPRNASAQTAYRTGWDDPVGRAWSLLDVALITLDLFGAKYMVPAACLAERCTCLDDDEISHFDQYLECVRCHQRLWDVKRRRMNTAYENHESNFTEQCEPCFEETEREWGAQWFEYYAGVL